MCKDFILNQVQEIFISKRFEYYCKVLLLSTITDRYFYWVIITEDFNNLCDDIMEDW